eukprot:3971626-Amphidinium_carterae.2
MTAYQKLCEKTKEHEKQMKDEYDAAINQHERDTTNELHDKTLEIHRQVANSRLQHLQRRRAEEEQRDVRAQQGQQTQAATAMTSAIPKAPPIGVRPSTSSNLTEDQKIRAARLLREQVEAQTQRVQSANAPLPPQHHQHRETLTMTEQDLLSQREAQEAQAAQQREAQDARGRDPQEVLQVQDDEDALPAIPEGLQAESSTTSITSFIRRRSHSRQFYRLRATKAQAARQKTRTGKTSRQHNSEDLEAKTQLRVYEEEMDLHAEHMWKKVLDRYGELEENEQYVEACNKKDDELLKEICWKYYTALRELHEEWRNNQIMKNNEKERLKNEKSKREEARQPEEAAIARLTSQPSTAASAASSTQPSTLPTKPTRDVRIPAAERQKQQVEESLQEKQKTILQTPAKQEMTPRLRLEPKNFRTKKDQKSDVYYKKKILQKMIQRSYIRYHPTAGYHKATPEMTRFYEGIEVHNFKDKYNPTCKHHRGV